MSHDLSGYEEVPDRIVKFHAKYPEGSLQGEHKLVEVGGKLFVEYIARAYRTPGDERPGVGTTWEPFPGTTPYTKNSEVENAETSAWGRALAALGFVGKKIASANEVRNRSAEQEGGRQKDGSIKPSDPQKNKIRGLVKRKDITVPQLEQMVGEITLAEDVEIDEGWVDKYLTGGRDGSASALIDRLDKGPIPEAPPPPPMPSSDVPADPSEFEHPAGPDDQFAPAQDAA